MTVEELEQKIIGFCLSEIAVLGRAVNIIDDDYFRKKEHKKLFTFIKRYYIKYRSTPSASVLKDIMKKRKAKQVDIIRFTNLYNACLTTIAKKDEFDFYFHEFVNNQHIKWFRESLDDNNGRDGALTLLEKKKKPEEAWELIKKVGMKIEVCQADDVIRDDLHETADEYIKQYDEETTGQKVVRGVLTGFKDVDEAVGGVEPGQMLLVAGRPGAGKSVCMLCMARNMYLGVDEQPPMDVLLISLEISREQYRNRWEASVGKLSESRLRSRMLKTDEYIRLQENIERAKNWPSVIRIVDITNFNAFGLEEEIELFIQKHSKPPDAVVVDYMGIMHPTEKQKSDHEAQARVVEEVRAVGRRLLIPTFSAVQLNRDKNKEKEKSTQRLSRSDIIGATADIVLQITDEDENDDIIDSNYMGFYFIKNRNGRSHFGFQMYKNFEVMDISDATQIDVDEAFDDLVGDIDKEIEEDKTEEDKQKNNKLLKAGKTNLVEDPDIEELVS